MYWASTLPCTTDHDWGPTVRVLLRDEDAALAPIIHEHLRHTLPHEFAGYPVGTEDAEDDPGVRRMQTTAAGPVNHRVTVTTLRHFVGWDYEQPMSTADWLTLPSQRLLELTSGAVHHDGVGDLTALRELLAFYPHDVWLYVLAAGWTRIGQEEHLMPRAGYVGDELGSALIGSRLVRDIMTLCFLVEHQYAPYPKWFGTAFGKLRCADELQPLLWQAQIASTWSEREAALGAAYSALARMHNALALTAPLDTSTRSFFGRPFQIIGGERFADALRERIMDPEVQRVARQRLIGSIDQWSDNTDLRAHSVWQPAIRRLYDVPEPTEKEQLMLNETDLEHLRTAIAIAARARDNGNHPFGALLVGADGAELAEGENTNVTAEDITGHADINLARLAFKHYDGATLQAATIYASTEPCAMCAAQSIGRHRPRGLCTQRREHGSHGVHQFR